MKNPHSSASLVDIMGSEKLLASIEGVMLANAFKSVLYDFLVSAVPQLSLKFLPCREGVKGELNPLCDGETSDMETSIMAEAKMSALLSNW